MPARRSASSSFSRSLATTSGRSRAREARVRELGPGARGVLLVLFDVLAELLEELRGIHGLLDVGVGLEAPADHGDRALGPGSRPLGSGCRRRAGR